MKRHFPLVLFLVLALGGCGGLLGRGDWDPFRSSAERQLSIFILNENAAHVSVVAVGPGTRMNLGTIDPRSRRAVAIPWSSRNSVRFQLELLAGRRHTTPSVLVGPGDRVELWIGDPVQRTVVRR